MRCFETIIQLFPEKIASQIKVLPAEYNILPEEIRVRRGQPLCIRSQNKEFTLNEIVSANDIAYIMMSATNGSFHSSQDTLKKGYLPLKHGARLGFCGEAATSQGEIRNIRNITSI